MIFRVYKKLYEKAGDFALRSEMGDMICKAAYLKSGYYIYNKFGEQVAQLSFDDKAKVATMAVATPNPVYPGAINMALTGKDSFSFYSNVIEKGDDQFIKNVKGAKSYNFSIWGKPSEYGYDVYDGSDLVANVIPYPQDEEVYQVKIHEKGNLFYIFMICLATERLQKDIVK